MRADREDRLSRGDTERRHSTQTLITAIAVLILAGGAYLLAPGGDDAPEPDDAPMTPAPALQIPEPPRPDPADAIREAPDIPEPVASVDPEAGAAEEPVDEPPVAETAQAAPEPAPPTPEQLDLRLREAIAATDLEPAALIAPGLNAPYLLDRGVSSIDQLARGLVPRRTLNLPRPRGTFTTTREGQQYRVDPATYRRYDPIVAAITALPTDTLAGLFQRFRAEIADAYASLGYPREAMDNTLIAALDAVIAAPVREEPPQLVSKGALWAYTDPRLENSSDLHRQLLRTGPENTRALQAWAQDLRDRLLTP
jgi:hypothetical protein